MMDKRKMKKLLILNLPYFLVGLFATNLGEAWRLAEGADSSAKILSFFHALPIALNNPFPSFHPLDLLIGDGTVAADAEILAMVVESLLSSGLKEFQISVGHAQFFRGLAEAAGLDEEQQQELRELLAMAKAAGVYKGDL